MISKLHKDVRQFEVLYNFFVVCQIISRFLTLTYVSIFCCSTDPVSKEQQSFKDLISALFLTAETIARRLNPEVHEKYNMHRLVMCLMEILTCTKKNLNHFLQKLPYVFACNCDSNHIYSLSNSF